MIRWISLVVVCGWSLGCGDDGGSSAGSGSGGVTTGTSAASDGGGSGGDGGGVGSGSGDGGGSGSQCDTEEDCPDGACVELVPGGVHVCVLPPVEAVECPPDNNGEPVVHECCESSECDAGICVSNLYGPRCSGAMQISMNICASDECADHADCADGMGCIPAGALAFPTASCVAVACMQDADCSDASGGRCVVEATTTCCNDLLPRCRYPDTPPVGDECPP